MFHSVAFEERMNATPGNRVLRYEECGHWLMHEDSFRFNRDVRTFLAETAADVEAGAGGANPRSRGLVSWSLVLLCLIYGCLAVFLVRML